MLTLMHWRVSFQGCKGQGSGVTSIWLRSCKLARACRASRFPALVTAATWPPNMVLPRLPEMPLQLACPTAAGMWLLGGAVVVMRLTGGTLAHVAGKARLGGCGVCFPQAQQLPAC